MYPPTPLTLLRLSSYRTCMRIIHYRKDSIRYTTAREIWQPGNLCWLNSELGVDPFLDTLRRYWPFILNFFHRRLTTGFISCAVRRRHLCLEIYGAVCLLFQWSCSKLSPKFGDCTRLKYPAEAIAL